MEQINGYPDYFTDDLKDRSAIFLPGEGEILSLKGGQVALKVTSGLTRDQLGVYEISLAPATVGAQLHYHRFMDETFIVTRGVLTVDFTDRAIEAPEGTVIYAPRLTPHGFRNNSSQDVTVMLLFNPGANREGFFRGLQETLNEQPINPEKFLKLYNKYDSFPVDTNNMLPAGANE